MRSFRKQNHSGVKVVGYGIVVFVMILLIEAISYLATDLLHPRGVFFNPRFIEQDYVKYVKIRNEDFGWLSKSQDIVGARPDKSAYSSSAACVELFGDSYTRSDEVGDTDAWGSRLSEMLRCRVLNFGVSGFGSDQALMRFIDSPRNADVVFLNHLSENILRNANQFRNFLYPGKQFAFKPRYIVNNGDLTLIEIPKISSDQLLDFFSNPEDFLLNEYFLPGGPSGVQHKASFPFSYSLMKSHSHFRIRAKLGRYSPIEPFYNDGHTSNSLTVTESIFLKFKDVAQRRGQIPIATIFPTCRDFQFYVLKGHFPYEPLAIFLKENFDHFIDFGKELNLLQPNFEPLYINCSRHFNEKGNELIAIIANQKLRGIAEF